MDSVTSLNAEGLAEVRMIIPCKSLRFVCQTRRFDHITRNLPTQAAEAKGLPKVVASTIRNRNIDGSTALELKAEVVDDFTENNLDRTNLKTALRSLQGSKAEAEDSDEPKGTVREPHRRGCPPLGPRYNYGP